MQLYYLGLLQKSFGFMTHHLKGKIPTTAQGLPLHTTVELLAGCKVATVD